MRPPTWADNTPSCRSVVTSIAFVSQGPCRCRAVALQGIRTIAVARDNWMSRTAFETSRAIRSILRT